ncbi:MAG: ADP-ribosylglycohydrolase family protein, partial [Clostridia bacterium]|nr:ADP-ribosylglycohydrolase family protein [Clostridia bacterium]
AGCALGAPVELFDFHFLEEYAGSLGIKYPPSDYWPDSPRADIPRYINGYSRDFTKKHMHFLPADDDIIYTILSLLILEEYGKHFTTPDVAEAWLKYLPPECTFTAERITLKNLMSGIAPHEAGNVNNPDKELIGAAIRCDGWAYINPGDPEKASEMAERDAILSHRGSGLHSAMYFAAVISSAFTESTIENALGTGLRYIPDGSYFSEQIKWALELSSSISCFRDANHAVSNRFPDMNPVHSVNNACLVVWGSLLGKDDFTRGISETVAMAYDNDCTAATVGSILGAHMGIEGIPCKWYLPWNNRVISYLNGIPEFSIDDIISRFLALGN